MESALRICGRWIYCFYFLYIVFYVSISKRGKLIEKAYNVNIFVVQNIFVYSFNYRNFYFIQGQRSGGRSESFEICVPPEGSPCPWMTQAVLVSFLSICDYSNFTEALIKGEISATQTRKT